MKLAQLIVPMTFLILAASASAQNAEALYKSKCQMCHAADGSGSTPAGKAMGAHNFKDPTVVSQSDAQLLAAIEKGKNKMPAYAGKMSPAEMQSVVTYVRQLQK